MSKVLRCFPPAAADVDADAAAAAAAAITMLLCVWLLVFLVRGLLQSAAAFLMAFFPGSSGMTIITDEDENAEVS